MNWKVLASEASTSTRSKSLLAGRVMHKLIAMFCVASVALTVAVVPMTGSASASAKKTSITYWFWGEGDIPGITKWMQQRINTYQKANPGVTITLVPQSDSTIIPSFALAAQNKSGPDIDTQWATLPVLQPALQGDVTPISKYVKTSETSHWLNTSENKYKGAIYAMPLYVIGVPLVWNKKLFVKAGLDPNKAPTTWTEFLADCAALKAHGITPLGMGNKDGDFGAWMFAIYEKQMLNSLSQLTEGVANKGNAQAKLLSSLGTMYTMFQGLISKGYINSNVASLDFAQGWQLFPQGKAAMSFTTDGNALSWAKTIGQANVGVGAPPIWGKGSLAKTYDATQSSSEFITSWSPNKKADAKFLAWLHTPTNMVALNKETGAFPADKRFPTSDITNPLAKQLDKLDTSGPSIWLENFIPPNIDTSADRPAGQLITSGGTSAQAVALWKQQLQLWQTQQPTQFNQFKIWAAAAG
jgi:raffinose/stachyose/melibiose transport system substrate-binding protein